MSTHVLLSDNAQATGNYFKFIMPIFCFVILIQHRDHNITRFDHDDIEVAKVTSIFLIAK